ncbi:MAG: hypothetical protein FWD46_06490 [Cystobacterineae bacterium]|nr:hypothetical protein [Cystobacterineae bacterium]
MKLIYTLPKEYAEKLERARAGETVDFYGNGSAYKQWTDINGVFHSESNGPPDHPYYGTSEKRPDGSEKSTFSEYGDGIIDKQEELDSEKRVLLFDTDRDGVFDKRVTLTAADNPDFFRVVEEERAPDGSWKKFRDELMPTQIEQLPDDAKKKANDDPMSSEGKEALFFENPAQAWEGADVKQAAVDYGPSAVVQINSITSGNGRCTQAEIQKITTAFDNIFTKSLKCLEATNPEMAKKINDALGSGTHEVNVYCGFEGDWFPPDANAYAKYILFGCTSFFPCVIKINRGYLDNTLERVTYPADIHAGILQQTLLHELLHTLGFDNYSWNHGKGEDKTYSCSRYCSGCVTGFGANEDCVRCASTREEKMKCGVKYNAPFGLPTTPILLCDIQDHGTPNNAPVFCNPATSRIAKFFYCDGKTSIPELDELWSGWYCCDVCPCVRNCLSGGNDHAVSCVDSFGRYIPLPPGQLALDCDKPPPFCR